MITRNQTGTAFAFTFVAIAIVALPPVSTGTIKPLRIMSLGDSITVGYTDNPTWSVPFEFGYRSGLYARLANAGYNFQFVGESPEPWDGKWNVPSNTPLLDLRLLGQDKHRGYGSARISRINDGIAEWIVNDNPDVILLMVGINGISTESPAMLNTLVNTIVTIVPDVHLIVAQITPLVSYNQALWDYNVYIRDMLVPTYIENGFNVTTVDLYSLFLVDPDDPTSIAEGVLSNNINHPTNELYDQIAQAWFDELEEIASLLDPNVPPVGNSVAMDDMQIFNYALDKVAIADLYLQGYPDTKLCVLDYASGYDTAGPEGGPDCYVDLYDFADLASHWLDCGVYPECQ